MLGHSLALCSQPSHWKHLIPLWSHPSQIVSIVALTHGIVLISITIPYTLLTVEGYWLQFSVAPEHHHFSCTVCSLRLAMLILPLCLSQSHSDSLPQVSPLALTQLYGLLSWVAGYIILVSSYIVAHGIMYNCLQSPWKRWSLKCFWTSLTLNIIGYILLNCIQYPLQLGYIWCHFLCLPLL